MPAGTNAIRESSLPPAGGVMLNLDAFRERTQKRKRTHETVDHPGLGQSWQRQLPQYGIHTELEIRFVGTITTVKGSGTVTTTDQWPYNLLKTFLGRINSQDRFNCSGIDLHVLEYISYPAFEPLSDAFPGSIGGGDTISTDLTDEPLELHWSVPWAADPHTFAGAVYAQSGNFNALLQGVVAAEADLFALTSDAAVTIDGEWKLIPKSFEVPQNTDGALIVPPGVQRLHMLNAFPTSFAGTGMKRVELVNADAQLLRLLCSFRSDTDQRLSAAPDEAAATKLDRLTLFHGAAEEPLDYDPASSLRTENNRHYGGILPFERLVFDTQREDGVRDAIYMQGLTELAVRFGVNSAVTVTNGESRLVQEVLI